MSNIILASGVEDVTGGSYSINRSVRLRSSAVGYFSRTAGVPTSPYIWTVSAWIKLGQNPSGGTFTILGGGNTTPNWLYNGINSADGTFQLFAPNTGATVNLITTQVFRDYSAWYHIVIAVDTTQTIASNRVKIYVNGNQVTSFSGTVTYPAQNATFFWNQNGIVQRIGSTTGAGSFDGYMAEIYGIDGQQLPASAFGEYDSTRNTQWKPKKYTGTYGTNGFYLNFSDNSAATAAAIGKDSSGNGNNWTPNNISVTAGATYDSMLDVPTLTSGSNANFATLNPIGVPFANGTVTDGNLKFAGLTTTDKGVAATISISSGTFYWESTQLSNSGASNCYAGVILTGASSDVNANRVYVRGDGVVWKYGTNLGTVFPTFTNNDVIGCAYDRANNTLALYKNGTLGYTVTSLNNADHTPWVGGYTTTDTWAINFGQRPFSYTPPSGFLALNTYNLPDGNVPSSDDYHKVYTYTGNGGGLQVGEVQKPMSLFNLDRSLRFRSSASAYLSKTFASAGSRTAWTWSGWVKRGTLDTRQDLFSYDNSNLISFNASNILVAECYNGAGADYYLNSTNVYRDPLVWNHVVVVWDSNNAAPGDRQRVYVNGLRITGTTGNAIPSGALSALNTASAHNIGRSTSGSFNFDGYLADLYFIDGQALDPTNFGTYDGNYYWTPKAYTGTYGTNGFHLDFEDFSAATAAAIGKDTSGLGNNWTPSAGINLTTPANTNTSWDSMTDVPTLTSADTADYCTLNPLSANTATVPTQGNLYLGNNATNNFACVGTLGVSSGKWYWELTPDSGFSQIGVTTLPALPANTTLTQTGTFALAVYGANGQKYDNGANTAYGATFTTTNVIGVALDLDAGTLTFYKDGVSQGVAFSGLRGTYYPVLGSPNTYNSGYINFGQRPFKYSNYGVDRPASTFKPINSFNIAEVTGDLESPDFVWIKSRSAGTDHALFNSVAGTGKYIRSSNTGAEVTDVNSLIQFNKNGFLLGNAAIVNTSAATYVASAWKVAATTVTNNAGSVASQVRANPTAGISIVTWTGTGANNPTIGHGLGRVPALILAKDRDTNATDNNVWVYHKDIGTNYYILLTSPNLRTSGAANGWIGTSPSDTTFTIAAGGTSSNNLNEINDRFEAICFAEIPGFSKFTSYAANASSTGDGPFVNCGFEPRWIMIKRATGGSGTGGWIMYDTARDKYNVMSEYLFAEGPAGAGTLAAIDVTANGFKIKTNNVHLNQTANDIYIVMAFAEHPFKYALAR